jgi:hypothetical protein
MDNSIVLLEQIRMEASRIEEDATYSSCGHFEASKPWAHLNLWVGIPLIIVSALGGVAAIKDLPIAASVIAFAVSAGTALMTFLSPGDRHKLHAECGNAYAALRNDARIFRCIDCASGAANAALVAKLQELTRRRNELNSSSPIIPDRAFQKARNGIEEGQKSHHIDGNSQGSQ